MVRKVSSVLLPIDNSLEISWIRVFELYWNILLNIFWNNNQQSTRSMAYFTNTLAFLNKYTWTEQAVLIDSLPCECYAASPQLLWTGCAVLLQVRRVHYGNNWESFKIIIKPNSVNWLHHFIVKYRIILYFRGIGSSTLEGTKESLAKLLGWAKARS